MHHASDSDRSSEGRVVSSTAVHLLTVGVIADRLSEPIHRIEYILRSRNVRPAGIAGTARVYDEEAIARIAEELRRIDARKDGAA
jgi:hypothetical protein